MSETHNDNPIIPEPLPGVIRIDFEATILIRGCPNDVATSHRSRKQQVTKDNNINNNNDNYDDPPLLLWSLSSRVNSHITGIPLSVVNFFTRSAFGRLWSATLHVAEQILNGQRPQHQRAIAEKRDLYDFVERRMAVMVGKCQKTKTNKQQKIK